jgi:hypothetical protein
MPIRSRRCALLIAASLLVPLTAPVAAQTTPNRAAKADHVLAVVTENDVYVRSGPADSYYPFGRLKAGNVVKVIGEKYNWARVVTMGPAFGEFFGYIRYPKAEQARFRLSPDGRTGRTLGRLDLLAPNLNTNFNPRDSWKRILLLSADVELRVLETTETDREIVHRVVLPANAEGWISQALLEPASERQASAFLAAVTGKPQQRPTRTVAAPVKEQPSVPAEAPTEAPAEATVSKPTTTDTTGPERVLAREEPAIPAGPATTEQPAPIRTQLDTPIIVMQDAADIEPEKGVTPTLSSKSAQERLEDLEAAYRALREEPIVTAEVQPLRSLYLRLAEESEDHTVARYSGARAEQLEIWAGLQSRRGKFERVGQRLKLTVEEAQAVRTAMETTGQYVAVGRLAASTIYDGERLPRLFRLQDAATGRTLAYLKPNDGFDLHSVLGQVIGIRGEKTYDGGLRLNLITPSQIDLLAPSRD